jgi:hypothetical protein
MFVTGLFPIPSQIKSLYISDLTVFVAVVTVVTAFSSSFKHVSVFSIFSSKLNFDQIIPSQRSQMATARIDADFLSSQSRHNTLTSVTNPKSPLTMSTNRGPSLSTRATRSSVGFSYEIAGADLCRAKQ